jgi:hypothetical protein
LVDYQPQSAGQFYIIWTCFPPGQVAPLSVVISPHSPSSNFSIDHGPSPLSPLPFSPGGITRRLRLRPSATPIFNPTKLRAKFPNFCLLFPSSYIGSVKKKNWSQNILENLKKFTYSKQEINTCHGPFILAYISARQ